MPVTILKPIHKPRLGSRLDRKHPLSRGLVSRWLLNEFGGAKAWNIANPNNHGTLTNMDPTTDWVATPRGAGLTFDATNDRIDAARVDITAYPFSYAVWSVAPSGRAAGNGVLCDISRSGDTGHRLTLLMNATHNFEFVCRAGGGTSTCLTPGTYNDDLLHMIVGVGIAVNNFLLYVDGKEVDTSTTNTSAFPTSLDRETIGARRTTTTLAFYEGVIHDVAIYNRALSAAEVARMYKEPYANIIQQQYRSRFIAAAVGGGFQAAWVRNANVMIGGAPNA